MTLSNNSTPSQSVERVDPEGSCKNANCEPIISINELKIEKDTSTWLPNDYIRYSIIILNGLNFANLLKMEASQ